MVMIIKDPESYYKNLIFKLKIKPVDEEYFDSVAIDEDGTGNTEISEEGILRQAVDEAKRIKEEAYLKGIEEGEKKGRRDYEESIKRELELIAEIKNEMERFREKIFKSSEKEIIQLSIAIAEKIIKQKISKDDGMIVDCINNIMKSVPGLEGLMIHLNPEDYDYMHSSKKGIKKIESKYKEINFVSDRRIEKGGCIIETDAGNIDTQVSSQLKRIHQEIL